MAERVRENLLAVNQVTKRAFDDAGESLPGMNAYVLEAMQWAIDNDQVDWGTLVMVGNQVEAMGGWTADQVMNFLYPDDNGGLDLDAMQQAVNNLKDQPHWRIALQLLDELDFR